MPALLLLMQVVVAVALLAPVAVAVAPSAPLSARAAAAAERTELPPPVVGSNGTTLLAVRQLIASGSLPAPLQPALAGLLRAAQVALQFKGHGSQEQHLGCPETGPWSVTAKEVVPPSGDKHDFTYISTYSWPCNAGCPASYGAHRCQDWWRKPPDWSKCDNSTGLPWVGHDGFGQSKGQHDCDCSVLMANAAETLSQSYYLTKNESHAEGAAAVLRTWFVEAKTAMNPNMDYAGWTPGVSNGKSSGIIATTYRWRHRVTDAELLLRGSGHWTAQDSATFREWNRKYLEWLLTARLARSEANSTNNHFTWYEVQALALALSADNDSIAETIAGRIRSPEYRGRLQAQIVPNGSMPRETHREGGATYSCMNIDALFTLATVASHTAAGKDLWTWQESYPGSSGRGSVRHALDYLVKYATNASRAWPWHQEGAVSWQSFPWNGLKLQLRIASIVYQDERYEEAIAHLPWPGAGWDNGSAWAADVAQLLWPKISLKTDDNAESWYTRLNVPGPGQATSTSTSTPTGPPAPLYPCPLAHSWCHDSVAAADIELQRNVTYGSALNRLSGEVQALLLDVYAPRHRTRPRAALPVVVLIHGGGWKASGDISGKNGKNLVGTCLAFARRGFVAISIDYRCERAFGGSWLWVDAVADARTALTWVAAHSETLSLDMTRLAVYGTSAGAITVEGLLYLEHEKGLPLPPNISAAISVSGALFNDTASLCTTSSEPASGSTCFPPPGRSVWNKLYRHITAHSPPLIDFHGTADPVVPFANATARPAAKRNQSCSATDTRAFLSAAGAPNNLVPIPGAGHVPLTQVFTHPANVSFWGFLIAKLKTDDDSPAATTTWAFVAGGARVEVSLLPWPNRSTHGHPPFSVSFERPGDTSTRPWLIGQLPAVHCGQWHSPADGSLRWTRIEQLQGKEHPVWGKFNAVNITWTLQSTGSSFFTSILHFLDSDSVGFQQQYGGTCAGANYTELPSNASTVLGPEGHASLNPSAEFPSFAAPETSGAVRLTSDEIGYFTTGGVMNYGAMSQGVGLKGFEGGARGGPLVLFDVNKSRSNANALVLSTADHFTSSIIGMRRTCSHADWRRSVPPPLFRVPHADFSQHDLSGIDNLTEAQCADACLGSPMCNAYTWGSGGCGSRKSCIGGVRCYLKASTMGWTNRDGTSAQHSGYFCKDDASTTALVGGALSYVAHIPSGTAFMYLLSPLQGRGITAALDKWGGVLRQAYKLERQPSGAGSDPVGTQLGYWTDNGAVYDGRQPLTTANMSTLMKALSAEAIPIQYIQLDPYWCE